MKKITAAIILFISFLAITGCASNNIKSGSSVQADNYINDDDLQIVKSEKEEETSASSQKTSKAKSQKPKRTSSDVLHDLVTFTNADKYLKYDVVSLFTPELTGIKERNAVALIRLDDISAGWGSSYAAAYYIVQFDEESRSKLKNAIEQYFSDFENKRLQRKGKHTDRTYGRLKYRLDWGVTNVTTPNNGVGEGYMGYEFIKNSPYFVLNNYPFENDYYKRAGESTTRESMQLRYYFTRSQLRQLISVLSEENIAAQFADTNYFQEPTEADVY